MNAWLNEVAIVQVEPCRTDPSAWRLSARPDANLSALHEEGVGSARLALVMLPGEA